MKTGSASDLSGKSSGMVNSKTSSQTTPTTADADPEEVLTRSVGLSKHLTPTGRKASLVVKNNLWSFRVEGVGAQPKAAESWYTGRTRAEYARNAYLREFWDMSDTSQKGKSLGNPRS